MMRCICIIAYGSRMPYVVCFGAHIHNACVGYCQLFREFLILALQSFVRKLSTQLWSSSLVTNADSCVAVSQGAAFFNCQLTTHKAKARRASLTALGDPEH